MNDNRRNSERILWIDIYKAITIIFMVLGHLTSIWGGYVYQFHMASFFFISGYTTNLRKRGMVRTIWDKAFALLLPLFSVLIFMNLLVVCLVKLDIYDYFFANEYSGFFKNIRDFLINGNTIEWLGATWFIVVLYGIIILHKLIDVLFKENTIGYTMVVTLLFFIGYYMVSQGIQGKMGIFYMDLILVGQFFYGLGRILKLEDVLKECDNKKFNLIIIIMINLLLLYYYKCNQPAHVDFPSRIFKAPRLVFMASVNGIVFTYILAIFFSKIKYVNHIFSFIGRNTLGVVFFHFLFFKVGYGILYLWGKVPLTYLSNFVPTSEIGDTWWPMLMIVSMILSVSTWWVMTNVKYLKVLFGNNTIFLENMYCKAKKYVTTREWGGGVKSCNIFKKNIYNNRKNLIIFFILILLIIIPFWMQGIMCNDELQARFWSMQGFRAFYEHFWMEHITKGRILSTPIVSFTMFFGFMGNSNVTYRILPILSILVVTILFGCLVGKIFKNFYFGVFCSVISIAFLPITFEPTSPNAFVTLYNIPFAILLISFIIYECYLDNKNKKYLLLSMFLFMFACMSYELFVTYTFFYICLFLAKNDRKKIVAEISYPIITGTIFLGLYVISRIAFPSQYEGNQIGNFTLSSMFSILKHMFFASFPGYFLENKKYGWLFDVYQGNMQIIDYVRVFTVVLLLSTVCYKLLGVREGVSRKYKGHPFYIIGVGILYSIIPAIPIAISEMYQEHVGDQGFIALPTTFFTYFSATFVCCYIIWIITQRYIKKSIIMVVILFLGINLYQVQVMNSTISNEQNNNFERLCTIEEFMETKLVITKLKNCILYSKDVYETKNALAIHDGYWNSFLQMKGANTVIEHGLIEDEKFNKGTYNLYYVEDEYFAIMDGETVIIASQIKMKEMQSLKYFLGPLVKENHIDGVYDNGFYINYYEMKDEKYIPIREEELQENVGTDLLTADILNGYFNDGWLSKSNEFNIRSGKRGKINIVLACINEMKGNEKITVYVNDLMVLSQELKEGENVIVADSNTESIVKLRLEFNYQYKASATDIRMITALLKDMHTE